VVGVRWATGPDTCARDALLKPTAVRKTNTGGRAEIRYVSRKADCDACTLRAASGFGYLRLDLAA